MKKQELIEAILEESQIHHNIRISFSRINETDEIDNELLDQIIWSTSEMLADDFKMNWESEHSELGKVYSCGRSGATLYWDEYWDESKFKYPDYYLEEDDWDKESLQEMLKNIREFNEAVKNLMEDFYLNVNDRIDEEIINKKNNDKEDELYSKTLKIIRKHDFTKRLFHDLIYKKL